MAVVDKSTMNSYVCTNNQKKLKQQVFKSKMLQFILTHIMQAAITSKNNDTRKEIFMEICDKAWDELENNPQQKTKSVNFFVLDELVKKIESCEKTK